MAKSSGYVASPGMTAALQARDPATLTQATTRPASANVGGAPGGGLFTTRNLLLGAAGLTAFLLWRRSHKR